MKITFSKFVSRSAICLAFASAFLFTCQIGSAQHTSTNASTKCPSDLSWMLKYAAPNGRSDEANEKLVTLPCFQTALKKAFPLKRSFMGDSIEVSKTALLFVDVYGEGPQSDEGRYIRMTGCVPHSCPDTGMIWIDTKSPGQIVFAASHDIPANGDVYSDLFHLWLYSSTQIPANQSVPAPLLQSLQNVFKRERFISATIVQPDGQMSPAFPETLGLNQAQPATTK